MTRKYSTMNGTSLSFSVSRASGIGKPCLTGGDADMGRGLDIVGLG